MVVGRKVLGNLAGVAQLVVFRIVEADREGLDRPLRVAAHQPYHRRRIDTSRKKRAERYVGDHPNLDGFIEALQKFAFGTLGHRLFDPRPAIGRDEVPRLLQTPVTPYCGEPRRELSDAREQRRRTRYVAVAEIVPDRVHVDLNGHTRPGQQRFDFRGEQQHTVLVPQEQRLLAEAIACQHQSFASRVPDGKGEHAAQPLYAILAPLLVGVDDHLGVGGRTERVPSGLQIATQFLEVVDLAVEDDLDLAVLVAKRLVPGVQIDDRQSTMGQSDLHPAACGACGQESLVVRAAVGDRPRHPP